MDNKKPWYEKVGIWIGIIAGVCTILTFIISYIIIPNKSNEDKKATASVTPDVTPVANIEKEKIQTPPTNIKTPNPSKDIIFGSSTDGIYEQSSECDFEPEISEKHTESISGTNVNISKWNQEDLDIVGNNYNNGDKITISNYSYTSNSKIENKVKSTITIPKSTKTAEYYRNNTFTGTFVLEKSMAGNKSSGTLNILLDNIKVFSTGIIDGNTTKTFPFSFYCGNIDTITIEADISLKGNYFTYAIVDINE